MPESVIIIVVYKSKFWTVVIFRDWSTLSFMSCVILLILMLRYFQEQLTNLDLKNPQNFAAWTTILLSKDSPANNKRERKKYTLLSEVPRP